MKVDHRLLQKYWLGECTDEERCLVESWMQDGVPDQVYPLQAPQEEETAKSVLWKRIAAQTQLSEEVENRHIGSNKASILLKVAAAVVLLIGIGGYMWVHDGGLPFRERKAVVFKTLVVPNGKRVLIVLSDGSKVHMNAGSTLQYPERFSKNERKVILKGEGFFEIQQNPDKPFYVEANDIQIRVLGTRFNVNNRKPKEKFVTVEQGNVLVTAKSSKDTLFLSAGMQARYTDGTLQEAHVNSNQYTGWKNGELIFNNMPLADVISELERCFAVDIKLADKKLAGTKVRAHFENATLKEVVHDIAFALNIRYKIKNKEVTFGR